jgi:hypothetical protein
MDRKEKRGSKKREATARKHQEDKSVAVHTHCYIRKNRRIDPMFRKYSDFKKQHIITL